MAGYVTVYHRVCYPVHYPTVYKYLLQKIASLFASRLLSGMKVTTVSFIYFFICYGRSAAQLTTAEKQEALEFHNDLRRSEGASDMFCMVTIILHASTYTALAFCCKARFY